MKTKWNFLMALFLLATLVGGSTGLAKAQTGILAISPAEGTLGSVVTLTGAGFGEKQGEVLLGAEKCKLLSWSDTEITFLVDKPQLPGEYSITVLPQGDKNPVEPITFPNFAIRRPMILSSAAGPIVDGKTVTVEGEFFGDKKGDVIFGYVNGGMVAENAKVVDWSMNAIRFEPPEGLSGRFVLIVRNEVGALAVLVDLAGGIVGYAPPLPDSYGNEFGFDTAGGIYYKGKFYVVSTDPTCDAKPGCEYVRLRTFDAVTGGLSAKLPLPQKVASYAQVTPLVVENDLWLFATGQGGMFYNSGWIWYIRYNYDELTGTGTFTDWKQVLELKSNDYFETAPVYNPITKRISVYFEYENHLNWAYSDNYGATWVDGSDVSPWTSANAGPSAVYYEGVSWDGKPYDTILAVNIQTNFGKVFAVKNGVIVDTLLDHLGYYCHRPFLVDLDPSYLGLVFGQCDGTPMIRMMDKSTGKWTFANKALPPFSNDDNYSFGWHPNLAINYEPNSNGIRVPYVFWGYDVYFAYMPNPEHKWMMTPLRSLTPGLPLPAYTEVSATQWHGCGLKADQTVVCWGENDRGRLGPPPGTYKQISSASWHNCGIKTDGTIYCWGADDGGRLIPPVGTFKQISVADWHGCGIATDGSMHCWGKADDGRTASPSGTYKQVTTGNWHNCAIKSDDHVICWGDEEEGRMSPPADTFSQISAADWHTCGVRTNGTIVCWGNNDENRVSPLPVDANTPGTYKAISAGNWHTCALRTNGSIVCWGSNDNGRVSSTPTGYFKSLDAGDRNTCAIRTNDLIACWGINDQLQSEPPY